MKYIYKNKLLVIFVLITLAGLALYYSRQEVLWNLFSALDTASAVSLSVLAFFGYLEYSKSEDQIKIYLKVEDEEPLDTQLSVLRKNCTRSEVFGILGMIQKDSKKRYDIKYMKDISLLHTLQEIQKGDRDEFIIPLTQGEVEQFDVNQKKRS
jgi:ABC-type uncharacterized transport system involved in gliding motility auxiliary subunit